jgi:hypothetical protein
MTSGGFRPAGAGPAALSTEHEADRAVIILHNAIVSLFTETGTKMPPKLAMAYKHRELLQWGQYTAWVFEMDTTLEQRRALRSRWQDAVTKRAETFRQEDLFGETVVPKNMFTMTPRVLRSAPVTFERVARPVKSVKPLLDTELQATNEAEFTELLRATQVRSGLNPAQVAIRAGLARSQAYSLVRRGKLPTKPEQVRAFITACGLPEAQIQRVMALWVELRERKDGLLGPQRVLPELDQLEAALMCRLEHQGDQKESDRSVGDLLGSARRTSGKRMSISARAIVVIVAEELVKQFLSPNDATASRLWASAQRANSLTVEALPQTG